LSFEWIYITLHISFYGVLFAFALLGLYRKLKSDLGSVKLEDVTLIVPFRDEENTLPSLLKDLRKQEKLPKKFLFIDDHSSDEGSALVRNYLNEFDLEVLGLPDDLFGKKKAIQFGVQNAATKYCVTLDADVELGVDYFRSLELLEDADMWILPVRMTGKTFFAQLASVDVTLSNILNRAFSVLRRPVLASGANLMFRTESYLELAKSDHFDLLSGDDMFLLRDFRKADRNIRVTSDQRLTVSTEAPSSLHQWLGQRVRWISKTKRVGDILPLIFAIINFSMGVFFYVAFAHLLCTDLWTSIYLLLFKLFYDTLLMTPHFLSDRNERALLLLPFYNLLMPLYSIMLALLSKTYNPQWKGRSLK
jgi:cellulose synthase/poly-beta-1,6-N-acetylglucosamine synthase-like glycosyltransferase